MPDTPPVPTTLITGALGVGKTSAIRDLSLKRPPGERWVVLVNELGEVGIDGALIEGDGDDALEVAELPGGCLCCTARGPMLGRLRTVLDRLSPDRLLVEPSGVADPGRVLDDLRSLSDTTGRHALQLQATIVLIDPRAITDADRRQGPWTAQIEAAEVLVANKVDLCTGAEVRAFLEWADARFPAPQVVATTVGGELAPEWLDLPGQWKPPTPHAVHGSLARIEPAWHDETGLLPTILGEDLFRRAWSGPHHETCGWRLPAHRVLGRDALLRLLLQCADRDCPWLPGGALRAKAVAHTDAGWFSFQADLDGLRVRPTAWRTDSRLELIGPRPGAGGNDWAAIDAVLQAAVLPVTP